MGMDKDIINHKREILEIHQKRLRELEKQAALYGPSTEPAIKVEIDNIKKEIARLEIDITKLSSSLSEPMTAEEEAQVVKKMRIFLASSRESFEMLREISVWIEEAGHDSLTWDSPSLFLPGENTFKKLIDISKQVDAAIFIYSQDDKIWYRSDTDAFKQPIENILIEYGLFAGQLGGQRRIIICRKGDRNTNRDIRGNIFIDMNRPQSAHYRIKNWIDNLITHKDEDPTVSILRREIDNIKTQLAFEQQKTRDLQSILAEKGVIDFRSYDFSTDAHWKLLFDYEYFWDTVLLITRHFRTPRAWRLELEGCGLSYLVGRIDWGQQKSETHTRVFVAKVLRFFRFYQDWKDYTVFLEKTDGKLRASIDSIGKLRSSAIQKTAHTEE
jgi:predicted nucleotide-binding protein